MNSFNEVGLGFAEFVSQLLNETFDSVLSAQNYQLEKYIELENARNLSTERFFELYMDDEILEQRELDIFGISLLAKKVLSAEVIATIEEELGTTDGIVFKNRLTKNGYTEIQNFIKETVVNERKSLLDTLLNKTELARLVVDSGEIRAKLELTNLHDQDDDTAAAGKTASKRVIKPTKTPVTENNPIAEKPAPEGFSVRDKLQIKEFIDPETKGKTLIVDKNSIPEGLGIKSLIPDVRVIAKPVKMTATSNLYSEVVIKFKTI